MRKHYWSTIAMLIMIGLAAGSVDSKRSSTSTTASSSTGDGSSSNTDTYSADSSNLEVDRIYSAQLQQYQTEHRVWAAGKEARAEAERELRGIEQKAASLADEKPIKPYYGTREWETRDGKYKTQAELIETNNVDVSLKKSDGKIVTVSKETLIHSSRLIVEKAFTELSAYKTRLSEWEAQSIKLDDLKRASEKKFAALNKPEPRPPSRETIAAKILAEAPAKPAAQTEVPDSRLALPVNLRIMSTDAFGTGTVEQSNKLISLLTNDSDAAATYMTQLLLAGDLFMFKKGEEVFFEKPGFILTKIRRRGTVDAFWVPAEFCIDPPSTTVAESRSKTGGANSKNQFNDEPSHSIKESLKSPAGDSIKVYVIANPAIQVDVIECRVRDYTNPSGNVFKMLCVDWMNISSSPIRILKADITAYSSDGKIAYQAKNYTIYAVYADEPGIAKGASYTEPRDSGHILLPELMIPISKVVSVKIRLTNAKEDGMVF